MPARCRDGTARPSPPRHEQCESHERSRKRSARTHKRRCSARLQPPTPGNRTQPMRQRVRARPTRMARVCAIVRKSGTVISMRPRLSIWGRDLASVRIAAPAWRIALWLVSRLGSKTPCSFAKTSALGFDHAGQVPPRRSDGLTTSAPNQALRWLTNIAFSSSQSRGSTFGAGPR